MQQPTETVHHQGIRRCSVRGPVLLDLNWDRVTCDDCLQERAHQQRWNRKFKIGGLATLGILAAIIIIAVLAGCSSPEPAKQPVSVQSRATATPVAADTPTPVPPTPTATIAPPTATPESAGIGSARFTAYSDLFIAYKNATPKEREALREELCNAALAAGKNKVQIVNRQFSTPGKPICP